MSHSTNNAFIPLNIAILTLSDSRTAATDSSGDGLQQLAETARHRVCERALIPHNRYKIRALVSQWIASDHIQVIILNGGTGFADGNCTPEAIRPLFDTEVDGFGELFRQLSYADIGSSSLQSRALAGMANGTLIFAIPGSGSACQHAWETLIAPQLDNRTRPCNFVAHLKNSPPTTSC